MIIRPLSISGAWEIIPELHGDARGVLLEWYRADHLSAVTGETFAFAQANISVSAHGVVRGIHYADVPPGQAKYVTCVQGRVFDVIVDLRVGSATFGRWDAVYLDDKDRRAVFLSEGLGHGFCSVTESATVAYLCSTAYDPAREREVHPLDPRLAITWPVDTPRLSARDKHAPTLTDALVAGLLPAAH
ncbi:dTDP-4-dehydrorhamnose 3,5-epimerase family protein [Paractinoplanes toevensis]|uniref:dTDP-4-dehydrorhamnose 3,5-epimerase n=1 Tax=Paractinoplanes toevensis TaxID=571911 RepID=A0A919T4M1_9ACTN|nr:dTDP-4-dehydrorhamnose 3,5-epimerase [Actinoplanes toevensis]GIM89123.1 dTDP-4-dehydrorhamnose 3,5-epimerase [Actinoplanes toevensis]